MHDSRKLNIRIVVAMIATTGSLCLLHSTSAQEQNKEDGRSKTEFTDYVKSRLPDADASMLERLFKAVDKDGDGRVSDAEFEKRMDALRKIQAAPVAAAGNRRQKQQRPARDLKDKQGDYERYSRRAAPRDKFPVFDNPKMTAAADSTMDDNEFVIGVVCDGEAKAYPITVMGKHELGNDVCGKAHITVSW